MVSFRDLPDELILMQILSHFSATELRLLTRCRTRLGRLARKYEATLAERPGVRLRRGVAIESRGVVHAAGIVPVPHPLRPRLFLLYRAEDHAIHLISDTSTRVLATRWLPPSLPAPHELSFSACGRHVLVSFPYVAATFELVSCFQGIKRDSISSNSSSNNNNNNSNNRNSNGDEEKFQLLPRATAHFLFATEHGSWTNHAVALEIDGFAEQAHGLTYLEPPRCFAAVSQDGRTVYLVASHGMQNGAPAGVIVATVPSTSPSLVRVSVPPLHPSSEMDGQAAMASHTSEQRNTTSADQRALRGTIHETFGIAPLPHAVPSPNTTPHAPSTLSQHSAFEFSQSVMVHDVKSVTRCFALSAAHGTPTVDINAPAGSPACALVLHNGRAYVLSLDENAHTARCTGHEEYNTQGSCHNSAGFRRGLDMEKLLLTQPLLTTRGQIITAALTPSGADVDAVVVRRLPRCGSNPNRRRRSRRGSNCPQGYCAQPVSWIDDSTRNKLCFSLWRHCAGDRVDSAVGFPRKQMYHAECDETQYGSLGVKRDHRGTVLTVLFSGNGAVCIVVRGHDARDDGAGPCWEVSGWDVVHRYPNVSCKNVGSEHYSKRDQSEENPQQTRKSSTDVVLRVKWKDGGLFDIGSLTLSHDGQLLLGGWHCINKRLDFALGTEGGYFVAVAAVASGQLVRTVHCGGGRYSYSGADFQTWDVVPSRIGCRAHFVGHSGQEAIVLLAAVDSGWVTTTVVPCDEEKVRF